MYNYFFYKKHLLVFFSATFYYCSIFSQGTDLNGYSLDKDILYRSEANGTLTAYMQERCLLDIYYPTNKKDFASVR